MDKRKLKTENTDILIYENGKCPPAVYISRGSCEDEECDRIAARVKKLLGKAPFMIVFFSVEDFNGDLSPWMWSDETGSKSFSGNGKKTLDVLVKNIIPVSEDGNQTKRYIAGYSLAGLFALWAFYETGIFCGAGSMSGSLWFGGWDEYIKNATAPVGSAVYLSLGLKEEKTKDPVMSRVGEMTEFTKKAIDNDRNVVCSDLVYCPGGHFTEVTLRIADGIAWLIKQ